MTILFTITNAGAVLYIVCGTLFSSLVFIHISFVYLVLLTSLALINLGCLIIPDLTQEDNSLSDPIVTVPSEAVLQFLLSEALRV